MTPLTYGRELIAVKHRLIQVRLSRQIDSTCAEAVGLIECLPRQASAALPRTPAADALR